MMKDRKIQTKRMIWIMAMTCLIMMSLATQAYAGYSLTTTIQGFGSVTKTPNKASYNSGEVVTLQALPDPGYVFGAWSGAVAGSVPTISVTVDGNKTVTAIFGTQSVHVSKTGMDDKDHPGTAALPVASIKRAIELIDGQTGDGEIIIHQGTYTEAIVVGALAGVAATNPSRRLMIRAADNEKVTFDGGTVIDDQAVPMPGAGNVYLYKPKEHDAGKNFQKTRLSPGVWEEDIRVFYSRASTFDALKAREYTCMMLPDQETVAFHPKNGESLRGKNIRIGLQGIGLWIYKRDNVTIKNLNFLNYQKDFWSTAINLYYSNNCVIDNCHVFNTYRGFMVGGENATVVNSHVVDTVTGVYVGNKNAVVKHCVFEKNTDRFRLHVAHSQDDSGIHYYNPAHGGTVLYNIVYGYRFGTFFKGVSGTFIVEHNTLVYGHPPIYLNTPIGAATHQSNWTSECRTQYNIMAGYPYMRVDGVSLASGSIYDHNIVFSPEYPDNMNRQINEIKNFGLHNLIADPLLAMPEKKAFDLLPGSSALTNVDLIDSRDGNGPPKPAGALGMVSGVFEAPPYLRVEAQPPAIQDVLYNPEQIKYYSRLTQDRKVVLRLFANSTDPSVSTRIQVNDEPLQETPFVETVEIMLPDQDGLHRLRIAVRNKTGWSDPVVMHIRLARQSPQITNPEVLVNAQGGLVRITTDRPINSGSVEFSDDNWVTSKKGTCWKSTDVLPAQFYNRDLRYTFSINDLTEGKTYGYRITIADAYAHTAVYSGTIKAEGHTKTLYVAPDGVDAEDHGSLNQPFKTLQLALDKALPGDSVVLKPGVYFQAGLLNHGGTKDHPITIEALEPQSVIFDGLRESSYLIYLSNAPYVTMRGLNLNSFLTAGISINQSPHVTVSQCQIINSGWEQADTLEGHGIFVAYSPYVQVDHCVLARMANGIYIYVGSDHARIAHNTLAGIRGYAILFIPFFGSILEGSEVQFNCIAFTNISAFGLREGGKDFAKLSTLTSLDYNNYATRIRDSAPIFPDTNIELPFEFPYFTVGKQFVTYTYTNHVTYEDISTLFHRMDSVGKSGDANYYCGWREYSGKDTNTIAADPRFVDPELGRFDVRQESPNLLSNGEVIGAIGHLPNLRQPPKVTLIAPTDGARFTAPATFTLKADVKADKDGSVRSVGFYLGSGLLKELTNPPYTFTYSRPVGEYTFRVMATDDSGLKTASSPIKVIIQAESVYGDLSGDGKVTAHDAALATKITARGNPTPDELKRGDVNGDGKIDAADAALIAKKAVGLID